MPDQLTALVLIGLGGWRIAFLLVREDGPFDFVLLLRRALGVPDEGEIEGFFARLLTCIYCTSFWTVAALSGLYYVEPWAVVPFAAWGLVMLLERLCAR